MSLRLAPVLPETRYARSGDVAIAYQVTGEGPFDVVYVPGFVSDVELGWSWPPFDRILQRLATFARLIIFDKRGTGMSDRVSGAPTLETRMDDVRAVMEAAGSSRAALFAISDGVPMSLLFAATYPQRTIALALVGVFTRWAWASDYPWGRTDEKRRLMAAGVAQFFFGTPEERKGAARWVANLSDAELERFANYARRAASPAVMRAIGEVGEELDVRHLLPSIRVPTLLAHGTDDITNPIQEARYAAERISGARLLELPAERHIPTGPQLERMLDEVERFLRDAAEGEAAEEEPDRVLATVLFTDIVGSSERAAALGDRAWRELLARHHELVRRQLVRFRGREVDTAGDGFLASFDGPGRAIRCASAIVEDVRLLGLEVRAGLHTGECEVLDGKVAGIAVHTGARVAAHAQPGEVLVSGTVKDLVAGSGIALQDRGTHELKGVPGEWRLYAVGVHG
jgi:class 3 adenylate cyclase